MRTLGARRADKSRHHLDVFCTFRRTPGSCFLHRRAERIGPYALGLPSTGLGVAMKEAQEFAKFVGGRACSLRHKCGLTQDQLAERSGLSRDEISRIERGGRNPRLETIWRLTQGLGVTLQEFFSSEGTSSPVMDEHAERVSRLDHHLRSVDAEEADRLVAAVIILCKRTPADRRRARTRRPVSPRRPSGRCPS